MHTNLFNIYFLYLSHTKKFIQRYYKIVTRYSLSFAMYKTFFCVSVFKLFFYLTSFLIIFCCSVFIDFFLFFSVPVIYFLNFLCLCRKINFRCQFCLLVCLFYFICFLSVLSSGKFLSSICNVNRLVYMQCRASSLLS